MSNEVNTVTVEAPALHRVLGIITAQVIQQAMQEGGPDPDNRVLNLNVDCTGDSVLGAVLDAKGELVIRITRKIDVPEAGEELRRVMAVQRVNAGISPAQQSVECG